MAKAYSYDFRQKVVQAIEVDGLKKSAVSQFFNISRNTIDLWLKRKAAASSESTSEDHGLGQVSCLCQGARE